MGRIVMIAGHKEERCFRSRIGIDCLTRHKIEQIPGVQCVSNWGTFAIRVFADPECWDEVSPQVIQILEELEGGS